MNTYFIFGVVLAFVALANTEEEVSNNREARLFGGGWGWKKPAVETVFITYPKKGWGWKGHSHHGPAIHHYPAQQHHGWGQQQQQGWGWQPQKHIHLPGGHFEAPGWGWEGGYSKKAAKAHKKAHKKGGGWGWQQPQVGWGWQDPHQGWGWERADVPTSAELVSGRILESGESFEGPDSSEVPFVPEYPAQYGEY